MYEALDLKQIGARIRTVDSLILSLAKRRMELAEQVALKKFQTGDPIFRSSVEDDRIADIVKLAHSEGINPHFASSLLYLLINESCKQQMILTQNGSLPILGDRTDDEWYAELKRNLLTLTERWSSTYDEKYENAFFATSEYLRFEFMRILQITKELIPRNNDLCIDLGCATGRLTFELSKYFKETRGYDISQHMIAHANERVGEGTDISFVQADIEDGIPEENNSVSFVIMNLGTASDVRNIKKVIQESIRVLKPDGRFLFSFYNSEALLYQWEFLPWKVDLAASINMTKHCLEVQSENERLSIYARPYSVDEVIKLFAELGMKVDIETYPAISALLPHEIVHDKPHIQKAISAIDRTLTATTMGAYIVVTGMKKGY